MYETPSSPRAAFLLLKLRGRRLLNFYRSVYSFGRKKSSQKRQATAAKGASPVLIFFIALYMIAMIFMLGYGIGQQFHFRFPVAEILSSALALHFLSQLVGATLLGMGNRELAKTDSDIEWLSSLPSTLPPLLIGKILERAYFNFFSIIMLVQFLSLQMTAGLGWFALTFKVIFLFCPLLFASALWQISIEYYLRSKLSPAKLRNASAILGVIGIVPIIFSFQPSMMAGNLLHLISITPSWAYLFLPLLIAKLGVSQVLDPFTDFLFIMIQLSLILIVGFAVLRRVLSRGFDVKSSRESERGLGRKTKARDKRENKLWLRLTPLARRELTLLKRDRSYFMQILFAPLFLVGLNLYSTLGLLKEGIEDTSVFFITFFLSSTYVSCAAAFQALSSEGHTLWIMASLPLSIEDLLKKKLRVWIVFAYIFTVSVLVFCHLRGGLPLSALNLTRDAAVLAGVFFYSWVALSIGVLNGNPTEESQKKVKPSSFYYFMGLASLFIPALRTESLWGVFVHTVLLACVSFSLWQEARSYLPYSLDPTAAPRSEISFVHGSVGTLLFFVLQTITAFFLYKPSADIATITFLSYLIAGLIVLLLMKVYLWKKKTSGEPRWIDSQWVKQGAIGLGSGLAVGCLALLYGKLNAHFHWFEIPKAAPESGLWKLALLAVLVAPPVEEYLFRGILFQGLLRRFPKIWAVLFSALIFAVVHPAIGFVPVFLMGLTMAVLFERYKTLWPGIIGHGTYNLVVTLGAYFAL